MELLLKYLIALIFTALLAACSAPISGVYADDHVKAAIASQNWDAAYRYLEYDLASNVPKHRVFPLNMIQQHPQIKIAADLIFTPEKIQRRIDNIATVNNNELINEGLRIESYKIIASYAEYQSARTYFESAVAIRQENEAKLEKEKRKGIEEALLKKEKEKAEILGALIHAQNNARFSCKGKTECDKAFSLTQIYLSNNADMKIQIATDTIIETFNPTDSMKLGIKAMKVPLKGDSSEIVLTVTCRDEKWDLYIEVCNKQLLRVYRDFPDFVQKSIRQ